jgi:hypothetical protein
MAINHLNSEINLNNVSNVTSYHSGNKMQAYLFCKAQSADAV